jgi:predicted transcriptional regulator
MNIPSSIVFDIFKRTDLSAAEKLVAVVIETKDNLDLTQINIARRTGLSTVTVSHAIKALRLRGELPSQRAMAAAVGLL